MFQFSTKSSTRRPCTCRRLRVNGLRSWWATPLTRCRRRVGASRGTSSRCGCLCRRGGRVASAFRRIQWCGGGRKGCRVAGSRRVCVTGALLGGRGCALGRVRDARCTLLLLSQEESAKAKNWSYGLGIVTIVWLTLSPISLQDPKILMDSGIGIKRAVMTEIKDSSMTRVIGALTPPRYLLSCSLKWSLRILKALYSSAYCGACLVSIFV